MNSSTDNVARASAAVRILEGLSNTRDPKVVDAAIGSTYYQHDPLIRDGPGPVRGFVESLAAVTQQIISVKRAVAEGDLAAVQSHYAWSPTFQLDGGQGSAVVDIFRFDPQGRITEHWDVAQAVPESSANGHTMFDGEGHPEAPTTPEQLAVNKALVSRFYDAIGSGDTSPLGRFIVEDCTQHNTQIPNGLAQVVGFFSRAGPVRVDLKRLIGQGDLVFAHVHYVSWNSAVVDIFRIDEGKIVEHWDVSQEIQATTASGNDVFSQLSCGVRPPQVRGPIAAPPAVFPDTARESALTASARLCTPATRIASSRWANLAASSPRTTRHGRAVCRDASGQPDVAPGAARALGIRLTQGLDGEGYLLSRCGPPRHTLMT